MHYMETRQHHMCAEGIVRRSVQINLFYVHYDKLLAILYTYLQLQEICGTYCTLEKEVNIMNRK